MAESKETGVTKEALFGLSLPAIMVGAVLAILFTSFEKNKK